MSYFEETPPENWNFGDALKRKSNERSFTNYQHLFDSIRRDLDRLDNEVANVWKLHWGVCIQAMRTKKIY